MIATIYPDRITVRQSRPFDIFSAYERNLAQKEKQQHPASLQNLSIAKTDFTLSKATVRKIRDTFSLLYELSPERKIEHKKNKWIYNFRLSFVTLTLPSKQIHTDTEIKSKCLNNFLTIMRNRFGLKNYIWVAELQKNQNIHFHLAFDLYIPHHAIRYYWNQSLNLLGYIDRYQKKFSKLSLSEYAQIRKKPISEVSKAFALGCRQGWRHPGTEQIIAIKNSKALIAYFSKYIAKNTAANTEADNDRLASFGRSWSRSESLSRIKYVSTWCWNSIKENITSIAEITELMTERVFDYCRVYYFKLKNQNAKFKKWINNHMQHLAEMYNYSPSPPITLNLKS